MFLYISIFNAINKNIVFHFIILIRLVFTLEINMGTVNFKIKNSKLLFLDNYFFILYNINLINNKKT